MPTSRPPSGDAGGAAGGQYPSPSMGNPPVQGFSRYDDFTRLGSAGNYGETGLALSLIGATSPTLALQTPTTNRESGILRISTGTVTANEGTALGLPVAVYGAGPSIGMVYICKVRATSTSAIEVWSGFAGSAARVHVASTVEFIGFRALGGTGTPWQGVVKNSGGETTVDMFSSITIGTDWVTLGFRYLVKRSRNTAPIAYGVQFFTVDGDTDLSAIETDVGDLVTTSLPTGALLHLPLGIVTTDGSDKSAEIDFYSVGGKSRR